MQGNMAWPIFALRFLNRVNFFDGRHKISGWLFAGNRRCVVVEMS